MSRMRLDPRTVIYDWCCKLGKCFHNSAGSRRFIGGRAEGQRTSMQWIYIARMLHRSLDLLVDARLILRNHQQAALIRWSIYCIERYTPDLKIPSYNEARIVNTAKEGGPRLTPGETFGIISHSVHALKSVCAAVSWSPLVQTFTLQGYRLGYESACRLAARNRQTNRSMFPLRAFVL
jgi:hypothetical protein